jgi:hypothetical protein
MSEIYTLQIILLPVFLSPKNIFFTIFMCISRNQKDYLCSQVHSSDVLYDFPIFSCNDSIYTLDSVVIPALAYAYSQG